MAVYFTPRYVARRDGNSYHEVGFYSQPRWRHAAWRSYHWYDMKTHWFWHHLGRLWKRETPLCVEQDFRCDSLSRKKRVDLASARITEEEYERLRKRR